MAIVAAASLALTSCGLGEPDSLSAEDREEAETGVAEAAAAIKAAAEPVSQWPTVPKIADPISLKGKKFYFVPIGESVPAIRSIGVGVTDALEQMGAEVRTCDGKFNPTEVATCLKAAADQDVDGIISYSIEYAQLRNTFDSVAKTGVPLLVSMGGKPGDFAKADNMAFFDTSPRLKKIYTTLADVAVSQEGAGTHALWLKVTDNATTVANLDAAAERFKERCPSCTLTEVEFGSATLDKLPSAVSAALVANPDINVVVQPVDGYVPQTLTGVNAAGFGKKVKVVSALGDLDGLKRVQSGQQAGDVGSAVTYDAWQVANAFVRLLNGEQPETYDSPVRVFTKENTKDLELTSAAYGTPTWYGDDSFKKQFLEAWGAR
ncbi:sugar ABC transporter substrate-binding protein [Streptomyces sp. NPDC001812]|uniref:Substrate-binding domain-containing protein n=1 Tax=Streptomyces cathayae TaxID=3031124 RepID=A0ABY8JZF6_9ACTN|nr:substrate-binding domain-containing protein [Streptomyces sp. HUAS 5]WGD39658.1 substrate-binding domain-containing protein [Streptomyces sp. HUAS 5]